MRTIIHTYPTMSDFETAAETETTDETETDRTPRPLILETFGADINPADPVAALTNIPNHRIATAGYTVTDREGRVLYLDIGHYVKSHWRDTNTRTGTVLKHPVKIIDDLNAVHVSAQYETKTGDCWGLNMFEFTAGKHYTRADVLNAVNEISAKPYTHIIIAPRGTVDALAHLEKIAGYRERDIIRDLYAVDLVQDDGHYCVLRFESLDGYTFEYEYNTKKITG